MQNQWNQCVLRIKHYGMVAGWGIPTVAEIREHVGLHKPVLVTRTSDITTAVDCQMEWWKRRVAGRVRERLGAQDPHYFLTGRLVHSGAELIEGGMAGETVALQVQGELDALAETAVRDTDIRELNAAKSWVPDTLKLYDSEVQDGIDSRNIATEQVVWLLITKGLSTPTLILQKHDNIRVDDSGALLVYDRKTRKPPHDIASDLLEMTNGFQLGAVYPMTLLTLWYQAHPAVMAAGVKSFGGARVQFWLKDPMPPSRDDVLREIPAYCKKCVTIKAGDTVPYTIVIDRAEHPRMDDDGWAAHTAENTERYTKHIRMVQAADTLRETWVRNTITEHTLPITDSSITNVMRSVTMALGDMVIAGSNWHKPRINPSACRRNHVPCTYLGTKGCPDDGGDDMVGSGWESPERDYVTEVDAALNSPDGLAGIEPTAVEVVESA